MILCSDVHGTTKDPLHAYPTSPMHIRQFGDMRDSYDTESFKDVHHLSPAPKTSIFRVPLIFWLIKK